jgi:hypothetical protein
MLDNPGETDFSQIEATQLIADVSPSSTPTKGEVLFLTADHEDGKRNKLDHLLAVRFYKGAVPDYQHYFATKEVIYVDEDMIEIRLPHDQTNVTVRVAQDADKLTLYAHHPKLAEKHHLDEHFFHDIAKSISDAGEVLITGPAQTKMALVKHIARHDPQLLSRIAGVESADHPTDGQMLAHARVYFETHDHMTAQKA